MSDENEVEPSDSVTRDLERFQVMLQKYGRLTAFGCLEKLEELESQLAAARAENERLARMVAGSEQAMSEYIEQRVQAEAATFAEYEADVVTPLRAENERLKAEAREAYAEERNTRDCLDNERDEHEATKAALSALTAEAERLRSALDAVRGVYRNFEDMVRWENVEEALALAASAGGQGKGEQG